MSGKDDSPSGDIWEDIWEWMLDRLVHFHVNLFDAPINLLTSPFLMPFPFQWAINGSISDWFSGWRQRWLLWQAVHLISALSAASIIAFEGSGLDFGICGVTVDWYGRRRHWWFLRRAEAPILASAGHWRWNQWLLLCVVAKNLAFVAASMITTESE